MNRLKYIAVVCSFMLLHAPGVKAQQSRFLLSGGLSAQFLRPDALKSNGAYKPRHPGMYYRVGLEVFYNAHYFAHSELILSLNKADMENGIIISSRLSFNYGYGLQYGRFKFSLNPGFTYVSLAYQDNVSGKTQTETRFAPGLGLQFDFALINGSRHYLSLFSEYAALLHKETKWAALLSSGLSWKPVLSRKKREAVSPL